MHLSDEQIPRPGVGKAGAHRVLAIAGSLRRDSLNRRLLQAAVDLAPPSLSISVWAELASVPLFNEDLEVGHGPRGVARLRAQVAASAGFLIATPEYNQSIPGVLKNAIDWLSRGEPDVLAGKPVGILGVTVGSWGTRLAQHALRHTLTACGALIMPGPQVYLRGGAELLTPEGIADETTRRQLGEYLAAFDNWIGTRRRDGLGAATPAAEVAA